MKFKPGVTSLFKKNKKKALSTKPILFLLALKKEIYSVKIIFLYQKS